MAYLSFMNNMIIHNQYALGLGRARTRCSSLPQGCPFSMRFLALAMLPWHKRCQMMKTIPRSLADDLLTHAAGRHCVLKATKALLFTNLYLMQIGAEAAVEKTWAYGSDAEIRKMCKIIWYGQCPSTQITTRLQARDIGGHLDTTHHGHNKTGTDRIESVIQDIRSHANIPSHPHSRYRIVIAKYLPAALYAISTSPENIRSVNRLLSAIADFLLGKKPHTDRKTRSTILAMYTCDTCPHTTCDPWHYILRQRCMDFRRCVFISPRVKDKLVENLAIYIKEGLPGTKSLDESHIYGPMPYLHSGTRNAWRNKRPCGPVSVLLQTLAGFTCYLDTHAVLHSPYAPAVSLLQSPLHTVQRSIYLICEGSVFQTMGVSRQNFKHQTSIDREATMHLINHPIITPLTETEILAEHDIKEPYTKKLLAIHRTARADCVAASLPADYKQPKSKLVQHDVGPWLMSALVDGNFNCNRAYKSKYIASPACLLCGAPDGNAEHITCFCPNTQAARIADPRLFGKYVKNITDVPVALRTHGIAPALAADFFGPFWDKKLTDPAPNDVTSYGRCNPTKISNKYVMLYTASQEPEYRERLLRQRRTDFFAFVTPETDISAQTSS